MKLKIAFALALSLFAGTTNAEKIALVNGTLINPGTSQIVRDATIVIWNCLEKSATARHRRQHS